MSSNHHNVAVRVYEDYSNGDHITDKELEQALKVYTEAANVLAVMGPVFRLACKEARYMRDMLIEVKVARAEQ